MLDFKTDVVDASNTIPVLVDFWAPWCGPCRMLGPLLDKLAGEAAGRFKLIKVNTDERQDLAQAFRISSIPAVMLFDKGKPIAQFVGALPEPQLRTWLEEHIPSEVAKWIQAGREALRRGERGEAERLLEQAHRAEPANDEARAHLALARFLDKPQPALELVAGINANSPLYSVVDAMRTLAHLRELPEQAPAGVVAEDWQRYLNGSAAAFRGDFGAAFETWLEVMRRNRTLDDDGARRACLALFSVLGESHPQTQQYRRVLATALY